MAMTMLGELRDAMGLVNKVTNHELYLKLVGLTDRVIALSDENQALRNANKKLEQMLQTKAKMTYEHPHYFAEGDLVPICAHCWDSEKKVIHLSGPTMFKLDTTRFPVKGMQCTHCKSKVQFSSSRGAYLEKFLEQHPAN
jgi:hypothetical protein